VALNPEFVEAGYLVVSLALKKGSSDASDPELVGIVDGLATKIRENMTLRRLAVIKAAAGEKLASYVHGEGEIGVVVRCSSDRPDDPEIVAFVFSLALHVAAFNPLALDRAKIEPAFIAEQEEIFRKQMEQDEKLKGKPANVLDGILKGKVNKLLSEICMMDQGYVKDDKQTVAHAVAECAKRSGAKLEIVDYAYFKVGT
jgi:elongation factor Ts